MIGLSIPATTFLARGYTGHPAQLTRLTVAALRHAEAGKGFAFLEALSPCVTYNDAYRSWRAAIIDLEEDAGHDPSDRAGAFARLAELRNRGCLPLGPLYRGDHAALESLALSPDQAPPALQDIDPKLHIYDYKQIMHSFMG